MPEEHKTHVRQFVEGIWNEGNLAEIDTFFAGEFVDHNPAIPGLPAGIEGARQVLDTYRRAFPDLRFTIHDIIAEGDKVAWRWSSRGTHLGDLLTIRATGRQTAVSGIEINRIASGRIVERWGNFDYLGLLTQLGVIPPLDASTPARK